MASTSSGQKFIAKNRAPRVQIEYDVELNGAEKKVDLPFVMGVISDLSGKPAEPLARVEERQLLEINSENFDDRLKAIKPRVAFTVPDVVSGKGNIPIEMTFESMADFSPAAVTAKVDGIKQLLEARQQLANLLSYMDGKQGAEDLLNNILKDPALLKALAQKAKDPDGTAGADTVSEETAK
ncbi:MAG: type VI secretion system contractile sheath small subunit [Treponema sp.]|jgi:type VI secretion system protein ImpB|nr:type VI secretion system contractile sheath small subunit [Treponema sp.]